MRREFPEKVKLAAFRRANGKCEGNCGGTRLYVGKFRYDHIIPDQLGGEPTLENCQVICSACDTAKTYKGDIPAIAKAKRRERKHAGIRPTSRFPGSRNSNIKFKINGQRVDRTTGEPV